MKEINGKPKEKKNEQKNKSAQKGVFNKTTDNFKLENILTEFQKTKANVDSGFDIGLHLTFLSDIIKAKKTQAYLSQAKCGIHERKFFLGNFANTTGEGEYFEFEITCNRNG